MTDLLAGLSSDEQWAARAVARAVSATTQAYDIGGRQGAVDETLTAGPGRSRSPRTPKRGRRSAMTSWPASSTGAEPRRRALVHQLRRSARIAELKRRYGRIYRSLRAGWREQSSASAVRSAGNRRLAVADRPSRREHRSREWKPVWRGVKRPAKPTSRGRTRVAEARMAGTSIE